MSITTNKARVIIGKILKFDYDTIEVLMFPNFTKIN